ncbi:hypothetical protein V2J09_002065 [Rumex salicifolius]
MAHHPKDDRSSSYVSPNSSNPLYFNEAMRSGYGAPVDPREAEFRRYPSDLRDPVEREKEKDRIRAEIMAEQVERRRILEEEIRMELMLEREVALKRWELSRTRFDHPPQARPVLHDPLRIRPDAPPEIHAPEIRQFVDQHSRTAPSETRQFVDERSRMRSDVPSTTYQFAHEHLRMHSDAPSEFRPLVHEPLRIPQPSSFLEERRMSLLTKVPSHQVVRDRFFGSSPYQHHPMMPTTSNLVMREPKPALTESRKDRILGSLPYQYHQMPRATSKKERILLVTFAFVICFVSVYTCKQVNSLTGIQCGYHMFILLITKHEVNASDLIKKRKASALGADHHRASNFEKKSKEGWRCDLCKVFTTSERTLNDHFKGKRHKVMEEETSNPVSKESTLNTVKPGPSHSIVKRTETSHTNSTVVSERQSTIMVDKKQKSKMDEPPRSEAAMAKKQQKSAKNEPPHTKKTVVDKKQNMKGLKAGDNGSVKGSSKAGDNGSVNKFKFWCGICQVGVTSQKALFDHEKGKKHLQNLLKEK